MSIGVSYKVRRFGKEVSGKTIIREYWVLLVYWENIYGKFRELALEEFLGTKKNRKSIK